MVTALPTTAVHTANETVGHFDRDISTLIPLVDRVLRYFAHHLPRHVDLADLRSVGILGLMHAIQRYDEYRTETFVAYARMRIKGAILDELRRMDTLPRCSRAKARALREANQELEQLNGHEPSHDELRTYLGLELHAYHRLLMQTQDISLVSLDIPIGESEDSCVNLYDTIVDERQTPGYWPLEKAEMLSLLALHLNKLPDRLRDLLTMLYIEEKPLGEIAEILNVTDSRVCQLRTQALVQLRTLVSEHIWS